MKYKITTNIFLFFLLILLGSCTDNVFEHGIVVKQKDLNKIRINHTKKDVAIELLGAPSIQAKRYNNDVLLYINYKMNKRSLQKQQLIEYSILELVFKNNKLTELNKSDLTDFQHIKFNQDETSYKKRKQNVLKQLLRNIGRFDDTGDI